MSNGLEPSGDFLVCLTEKLNEVANEVVVAAVKEGGGKTSVTGTTGTTNTVNIVINVGRKVIVNDMSNVGNIETASCNGGGNHNRSTTLPEGLKGHFTLPLGSVAVNGRSRVVVTGEEVAQYVGVLLGLDEDKSQATVSVRGKYVQEDRALIVFLNVFDFLGDIFRGGANTADGEEDIVLEEILGQDLNVSREGSAEHQGLAIVNTRHVLLLYNTTDLMFETHVKHAIRLVEDEVTDIGKTDATTFDHIDETPGGCA